jgi:putative spermidine/putrescine transport system permease protein/mannopine transport system permease protein
MKADLRDQWRIAAFALPALLFLTVMFAVPLARILLQSVTVNDGNAFSLSGYIKVFSTPLFAQVAYTTFEISVGATLFSFLLAYPVAYFLSRQAPAARAVWMILILVPFWTSSLVKSFAFTVILGQSGAVNQFIAHFGFGPWPMLFNRFGVLVGMSHFLVPFLVFPILSNLLAQPPELARAAEIMGSGKLRIFLRITFPLSMPGVITGALLAFILSLGFYIIPALLGSRKDMMLSNLIDFYAREILDVQTASAIAVMLTAVAIGVAFLLSRVRGGSSILSEAED